MEEVDAIILPILRDIGAQLPSTITSLKQLDSELFYHCCVYTLRAIDAATGSNAAAKHPPTMPAGKAARFRICTALATDIQSRGFRDELGYEVFLYPNETETRKVLRFLAEKLPKHEDKDDENNKQNEQRGKGTDRKAYIQNRITKALKAAAQSVWSPLTASSLTPVFYSVESYLATFIPPQVKSADQKAYYNSPHYQSIASQSPSQHAYFIALIEKNALETRRTVEKEQDWTNGASDSQRNDANKIPINERITQAFRSANNAPLRVSNYKRGDFSMFARADEHAVENAFLRRREFEQEKEKSAAQVVNEMGAVQRLHDEQEAAEKQEQEKARQEEEKRLAFEKQQEELNNELVSLTQGALDIDRQLEELTTNLRYLESDAATAESSLAKIEDVYKVKKKTMDLLPNAAKNAEDLTNLVQKNSKRLLDLAQEWENYRSPIVMKIRRARLLLAERKTQSIVKLEKMKSMREEMKEKSEELREKDSTLKAVTEEYNALPAGQNRQVYIRRIMDIMRNLTKQKQQIAAILEDVRRVQKDINGVSEATARSFAVADEVVFQVAKKSEKDRNQNQDNFHILAYKSVVQLREGFVDLVKNVEENGRLANESRELGASNDELEKKLGELNFERVQQDLAAVKKENKQLMAKLKGKSDDK